MNKRTINFEFKHRSIIRECLIAKNEHRVFTFKSRTVENRWAKVLEMLVISNDVEIWLYEPTTFKCGRKYRKDRQYTLDFSAFDINGIFEHPGETVWFETKSMGWFKQSDNSRLRWLAQSHPSLIVFLVFDRRPRQTHSKTAQKERRLVSKAEKWVERILYMDDYDHKK